MDSQPPLPLLPFYPASLRSKQKDVNSKEPQQSAIPSSSCQPETFLLGFSKGGTVLNQLVTKLGFSDLESPKNPDPQEHDGFHKTQIIPNSKNGLLNSITQIHYVDVGLSSAGAYLTDNKVIRQVANHTMGRNNNTGIRFVLHASWNSEAVVRYEAGFGQKGEG